MPPAFSRCGRRPVPGGAPRRRRTPMPTPPRVLPLILWLALAPTQPGLAGGHRGSDTSEAPASSPAARLLSERASPRQVGAVMALLATFEEAGALPPESSP